MIVITEMTATGHVYIRAATEHELTACRVTLTSFLTGKKTELVHMRHQFYPFPGTLQAVGKASSLDAPAVHCTKDNSPCGNWDATQTFLCSQCQRVCCYCVGADDEEPDWCDDCWAKKHSRKTHEQC